MKKAKQASPEIIVRNGEPVAVILNIDRYQALLERLEEIDDLRALAAMRKKQPKFRRLEEFLTEHSPDV